MTFSNRPSADEAILPPYADDPDIRVLRRVAPLSTIPLAPPTDGPVRFVSVVDTETTGTDPMTDEVIDVAVVTLEVDAAGQILGIVSAGQALRDPHMPIPAHITALTGLTDDDVRGKSIDLDRLEHRLRNADVLIAHNARFDVAFLETLMPGLVGAAWACSANDFDWFRAGFDGRKLGHLLMQAGWFNEAHRAMSDVISLIHVLSYRLPHGGTILGELLANAERPTVKFEATGAAYEKRSMLKARGYRWDPARRVWWCEITEDACIVEEQWFREQIAPAGPLPRMTKITWHQRHR